MTKELAEIIDRLTRAFNGVQNAPKVKGECSMVNEKGQEFVGFDAKAQPVFIGSRVDHTVKGFKGGYVREGFHQYRGEPAVIVDYPGNSGWLNRLSKLVVVPEPPPAPPKPKTIDTLTYNVNGKTLTVNITLQ